jgi:K+/H+ antiporter YhaU regulatory subunit KhtT
VRIWSRNTEEVAFVTPLSAIIALLIIILLTILINRIATVALMFTGVSREMAQFQARSALSTVGYATAEAESIVNHPVRRRIISLLMLLGNAGVAGILATVVVTFTAQGDNPFYVRLLPLGLGLFLLWVLATSTWVDDQLFRVIGWALRKFTHIESHDFVNLLHLGAGYSVTELHIEEEAWLVGRRLDELRLSDLGVNVLAIQRALQQFEGNPTGATYIRAGDKLIVYGNRDSIIAFDVQRGQADGEAAHFALLAQRRQAVDQAGDERRAARDEAGKPNTLGT